MATSTSLHEALQKLAKWRAVFAGWQLGTRIKEDPEAQALRDHRELSLLLRVEVNALVRILVDKGLITEQQWINTLEHEAQLYDRDLEERFPGARTSLNGVHFDERAHVWMKNWKP
jgi:hypothetical protein